MVRLRRWIALECLVLSFVTSFAVAQGQRDLDREENDRPEAARDSARNYDDDHNWAVRGGIGFTEGPDAFLMNVDFETMARDEVAVGIGVQLDVEDDFVVVSPTIFTRYIFDLSGFKNEAVRQARPFVQGGVGITHIDIDLRGSGRDRDGTDFMLNLGAGLDFPLDDSISIGTRLLVNIIPAEVLNQRIYFSWELISFRYSW